MTEITAEDNSKIDLRANSAEHQNPADENQVVIEKSADKQQPIGKAPIVIPWASKKLSLDDLEIRLKWLNLENSKKGNQSNLGEKDKKDAKIENQDLVFLEKEETTEERERAKPLGCKFCGEIQTDRLDYLRFHLKSKCKAAKNGSSFDDFDIRRIAESGLGPSLARLKFQHIVNQLNEQRKTEQICQELVTGYKLRRIRKKPKGLDEASAADFQDTLREFFQIEDDEDNPVKLANLRVSAYIPPSWRLLISAEKKKIRDRNRYRNRKSRAKAETEGKRPAKQLGKVVIIPLSGRPGPRQNITTSKPGITVQKFGHYVPGASNSRRYQPRFQQVPGVPPAFISHRITPQSAGIPPRLQPMFRRRKDVSPLPVPRPPLDGRRKDVPPPTFTRTLDSVPFYRPQCGIPAERMLGGSVFRKDLGQDDGLKNAWSVSDFVPDMEFCGKGEFMLGSSSIAEKAHAAVVNPPVDRPPIRAFATKPRPHWSSVFRRAPPGVKLQDLHTYRYNRKEEVSPEVSDEEIDEETSDSSSKDGSSPPPLSAAVSPTTWYTRPISSLVPQNRAGDTNVVQDKKRSAVAKPPSATCIVRTSIDLQKQLEDTLAAAQNEQPETITPKPAVIKKCLDSWERKKTPFDKNKKFFGTDAVGRVFRSGRQNSNSVFRTASLSVVPEEVKSARDKELLEFLCSRYRQAEEELSGEELQRETDPRGDRIWKLAARIIGYHKFQFGYHGSWNELQERARLDLFPKVFFETEQNYLDPKDRDYLRDFVLHMESKPPLKDEDDDTQKGEEEKPKTVQTRKRKFKSEAAKNKEKQAVIMEENLAALSQVAKSGTSDDMAKKLSSPELSDGAGVLAIAEEDEERPLAEDKETDEEEDSTMFRCCVCEAELKTPEGLLHHMKTLHAVKWKRGLCETCNKGLDAHCKEEEEEEGETQDSQKVDSEEKLESPKRVPEIITTMDGNEAETVSKESKGSAPIVSLISEAQKNQVVPEEEERKEEQEDTSGQEETVVSSGIASVSSEEISEEPDTASLVEKKYPFDEQEHEDTTGEEKDVFSGIATVVTEEDLEEQDSAGLVEKNSSSDEQELKDTSGEEKDVSSGKASVSTEEDSEEQECTCLVEKNPPSAEQELKDIRREEKEDDVSGGIASVSADEHLNEQDTTCLVEKIINPPSDEQEVRDIRIKEDEDVSSGIASVSMEERLEEQERTCLVEKNPPSDSRAERIEELLNPSHFLPVPIPEMMPPVLEPPTAGTLAQSMKKHEMQTLIDTPAKLVDVKSPKRKRGRPPKKKRKETEDSLVVPTLKSEDVAPETTGLLLKRKRGRPSNKEKQERMNLKEIMPPVVVVPRKRGRPSNKEKQKRSGAEKEKQEKNGGEKEKQEKNGGEKGKQERSPAETVPPMAERSRMNLNEIMPPVVLPRKPGRPSNKEKQERSGAEKGKQERNGEEKEKQEKNGGEKGKQERSPSETVPPTAERSIPRKRGRPSNKEKQERMSLEERMPPVVARSVPLTKRTPPKAHTANAQVDIIKCQELETEMFELAVTCLLRRAGDIYEDYNDKLFKLVGEDLAAWAQVKKDIWPQKPEFIVKVNSERKNRTNNTETEPLAEGEEDKNSRKGKAWEAEETHRVQSVGSYFPGNKKKRS